MKYAKTIMIEGLGFPITVDIDLDTLAERLGRVALLSKEAKAIEASGLVKVTCKKDHAVRLQKIIDDRIKAQRQADHEKAIEQ